MKDWSVELALPLWWHGGGECRVCLVAVYWMGGPGVSLSFPSAPGWRPLFVWTDAQR